MKISDIDKDFVDIIEYLDKNGFKPFACIFKCIYFIFEKS